MHSSDNKRHAKDGTKTTVIPPEKGLLNLLAPQIRSGLTDTEKQLLVAVTTGAVAGCCRFDTDRKALPIPLDCAIRADLVRWLSTNKDATAFVSASGIHVCGAYILGELDLSWASVPFPITLTYCKVDSAIKLQGAEIAQLSLDNSEIRSLDADSVQVRGSIFLREKFYCAQKVNLVGAAIGGDLDCSGGRFTELTVQRAKIVGAFIWRRIEQPLPTKLSLQGTSVGLLSDDLSSWPSGADLVLDGLVYGGIYGDPSMREPVKRLGWLALQPEKPFCPQPYIQLAKTLRDAGDDDGERVVLREMERRRRKQRDSGVFDQTISRVYDSSVGFGYYPEWAIWEILGLTALGWLFYRRGAVAKSLVPTDLEAYKSFKSTGESPDGYPKFSPLIYSLENSLPLVKLGQGDKWQPDSSSTGAPRNDGFSWWEWLKHSSTGPRRFALSPSFLRRFLWIQILIGWLLATLFLAGVTGIIRRH